MFARLIHPLAAAPFVVLLGTALALASSPQGDVTARDREVVARLTRGGVQRFDTDASHGASDATDVTGAGAPAPASPSAPAPAPTLTAAPPGLPPRADVLTMLDVPAIDPREGRPSAPPARGRAPPRR